MIYEIQDIPYQPKNGHQKMVGDYKAKIRQHQYITTKMSKIV